MDVYDITLYRISLFWLQWFIITIKPKSKENFFLCWIAIFCMQQNLTLKKVAQYSSIHYHTSFQNPKLCVASVAFTSKVYASIMVLLTRILKYR